MVLTRRSAQEKKAQPPPPEYGTVLDPSGVTLPHVPPHHLKNRFIYRGFRNFTSCMGCLDTFVNWNHESGNVYTTVFGIFLTAFLQFQVAAFDGEIDMGPLKLGMLLFQISNFLTMSYHLFCAYPPVYHFWSAADLAGINFALTGVAVAGVPNGLGITAYFYGADSPLWRVELVIILVLQVVASTIVVNTRIRIARESPVHLLVLNVITACIFILPPYFLWRAAVSWRAASALVLMGGGVILFLSKWPERSYPHVFDELGHSHMMWHVMYTVGYYMVYSDIFIALTGRADLLQF